MDLRQWFTFTNQIYFRQRSQISPSKMYLVFLFYIKWKLIQVGLYTQLNP